MEDICHKDNKKTCRCQRQVFRIGALGQIQAFKQPGPQAVREAPGYQAVCSNWELYSFA